MVDHLLQSAWQEAKHLTPQACAGLLFFERRFRDEQWYVIQKEGVDKVYRVNQQAWFILQQCNGERTLADVLVATRQYLSEQNHLEDILNEGDFLKAINQYAHEGLLLGVLAKTTGSEPPVSGVASLIKNPLFIRIPVFDPSYIADALAKRLVFVKSTAFAVAMLALFIVTLIQVVVYWQPLTGNIVDTVFRPGNWLWLALLYPLTKMIHELGHAVVVHLNGGRVKEAGIVLMYGMPLPYVEASDASTFAKKTDRVMVDMAGIIVELLMACGAFFVWLSVSEGLVHQLAYNVLIICSVSTVFFNANPLMRFDGYYALTDIAELPNLSSRANFYWRYLFKRFVFADPSAKFTASQREQYWLIPYGFLAYLYRWFVMLAIVFVVAKEVLFAGVVLAMYLAYLHILKPLYKLFEYCRQLAAEASVRPIVFSVAGLVFVLMAVFLVKVPVTTVADAVVMADPESKVVVAVEGELSTFWVADGETVKQGQRLLTIENQFLQVESKLAASKLKELRAQYAAARTEDPIEADQLKEDVLVAEQQLDNALRSLSYLVVLAETDGTFYRAPGKKELGIYVTKGDVLGYVLKPESLSVKVLVSQDELNLITDNEQVVTMQVGSHVQELVSGKIERIYQSATYQLPSPVFSARYGGTIALNPDDESGMTALDEWFEIDVRAQSNEQLGYVGSSASVKFSLADQSIGWQFYRKIRQLFMSELSI